MIPEMRNKFNDFERLAREWNQKMNLVAPGTLADFQTRHIADSAQLADFIGQGRVVCDLGSGAGLPAVVLAILGYKVFAVESIAKKCRFLEVVKTELDLPNLTILNQRAESLNDSELKIQNSEFVFTARAFAPLTRIFDWTAKYKIPYVLLKGESVMTEIQDAQKKYDFNYDLSPSKTGPGFILSVKNCKRAGNFRNFGANSV